MWRAALHARALCWRRRSSWRGSGGAARREPGYRRRIGERFGYYRERNAASGRCCGCTRCRWARRAPARRWCARSPPRIPDTTCCVTCMTAAGRETLKELHGESVRIAWLPYDYPGAVRRFLEHFRPRLGVLMETEIWPNLLAACAALRRAGAAGERAHVGEVGARLRRAGAAWRGRRSPRCRCVCAQSEEDAARLRALGARRVEVTGNLKFDSAPDEAKRAAGRAWRARLGAAGAAAGEHARGRGENAAGGAAGLGWKAARARRAAASAALRRGCRPLRSRAAAARRCRRRRTACIWATRWGRWISTTRRPTWR